MARKLQVQGAGTVKMIQPAIALLLAIVTLGIYYIFWYGIRNSELNDFGAAAYSQHHLNRLWEREAEREERRRMGVASEPPVA